MDRDAPISEQLSGGSLGEGFWDAVAGREAVCVVANGPAGPRLLEWLSCRRPAEWQEALVAWQEIARRGQDAPAGACSLLPQAVDPAWPAASHAAWSPPGPAVDVLLAIRPRHAEAILAGTKGFEFRRVLPARPVRRLVLYASAPVMAVVGEADAWGTVRGAKDEVWAECGAAAGITREEFDAYFAGRPGASAIRLGPATRYAEPRPLVGYGLRRPPQSFAYLVRGRA